jgi:hypothetical protein
MKWQNITARDLREIVGKLSLEQTQAKRRSPHPVFWYYLDGKKELRVTLPNIHGGAGSVSTGFLQQIKRSLRLSNREFEELVDCPLTAEEFETLLRERMDR